MTFSTPPSIKPEAAETSPMSVPNHGPVALIIDDDPLVRGLLGEMLRRIGFAAVLKAGSLADVEAMDSLDKVELCVIDWKLPGADGMDLLGRLRQGQLPLRPNAGAILITGLAEPEAVLKARQLGADSVIAKPFSKNAVAKAVARAMQHGRS